MEPVRYTFTIKYKDVSKKKCAFVGEHIPCDKRYERWLDEVGVSEMSMWIVDQVFNSEKKRLKENVTIPSSLMPIKGSKRNKQHIMNCMFRAVRKALTDYVLFKYENHVKAGWDPEDIKTAGFTLTVDVPGTGKAKDYKVDIVSQTGSTMRAIQALLNSTHDVFVDQRQYMQEQSRYQYGTFRE